MSKKNPWRPIDSCPYDTPVLLASYHDDYVDEKYNGWVMTVGIRLPEKDENPHPFIAENVALFDRTTKSGFVDHNDGRYDILHYAYLPTHWRKLPEAPR